MSPKAATSILSMDVVQLSRYVRRRFQASLLGTEDVDESRDVAFQILALKEGLRKDHREHLKIFYNLVQAAHCGFFSQKATRNLYIGFPYLHRHFSENYCTFAAETPAPASGLGDQLLFGAGRFLSQHTFSAAAAHLESLSNDSIGAFLHKARQFDEAVRLNKLYIRILVELLGKNALGEEVKASLRRALAEASKGWALGRVEELNYEHLIDLLGLTGGLGVEDPGLLPIIADSLGNKFEAVPIRGKLLMFFGLSSHVAKWGVEPSSSKVIDRLLGTFSDGYRSLDLKDSLLFVEALANVRYREQLLDQVVAENIIPRLSKIRMEDMMQLLESFVKLDFRCSRVIAEFEVSQTFKSLTVVDHAVLALLGKKLQYTSHMDHMFRKNGQPLSELADANLLEELKVVIPE